MPYEEPEAWSVVVELEGPAEANLDPDDPRLVGLYRDLNEAHGAAMAAGGNEISLRLTVDRAEDVTDSQAAADRGRQIVVDAVRAAGLDVWPVVTLEAVTFEELDRQGLGSDERTVTDGQPEDDDAAAPGGRRPRRSSQGVPIEGLSRSVDWKAAAAAAGMDQIARSLDLSRLVTEDLARAHKSVALSAASALRLDETMFGVAAQAQRHALNVLDQTSETRKLAERMLGQSAASGIAVAQAAALSQELLDRPVLDVIRKTTFPAIEDLLPTLRPLADIVIPRVTFTDAPQGTDRTVELIEDVEEFIADLPSEAVERLEAVAEAAIDAGRGLVAEMGTKALAWWRQAGRVERLLFVYAAYVAVMVVVSFVLGVVHPVDAPSPALLDPGSGGTVQHVAGAALGVGFGLAVREEDAPPPDPEPGAPVEEENEERGGS